MQLVTLPTGETLPALGLGTWRTGESPGSQRAEVAAVRLALQMGYRVIDTAEMYGEGGAEEVVGEAVGQAVAAGELRREELFVVSKVYPHNASRAGVRAACERSLKRLRLERIDLYLLHWRGQHALGETVAGFEALKQQGLIRHWGVSNFDTDDMEELIGVEHGDRCAANQVYYALSERGIEVDLLPWLRSHRMPCMAYCPLAQGGLAGDPALANVARRHGVSPTQVALAWVLAQPGVMPIPKAVREAHLRENLAARELVLRAEDMAELDQRFPPPKRKRPLAMS
ncbi:aldo/keto reductase [Piscinibacter sp. XHJ-5]|uniref:aldo/keto reductase n=1 Tax=Piscinibacter sp. XHJ-5 TaxID=3037797 RepID=UPI002452CEAE|nr:aldo/keto reductase [Piscinibacter sp. XHJ-5]